MYSICMHMGSIYLQYIYSIVLRYGVIVYVIIAFTIDDYFINLQLPIEQCHLI